MSKKDVKTNAMRILDTLNIDYKTHSYIDTDAVSGVEVAEALGQDKDKVFKTLVTVSKSNNNYVFMVPVAEELDLKKAAASVGEKSLEMLKLKELFPLTGYVHGGCSPLGMKKHFETVVNETAILFDTIVFSAGKIGYQIELPIDDLQKAIPLKLEDIVKDSP